MSLRRLGTVFAAVAALVAVSMASANAEAPLTVDGAGSAPAVLVQRDYLAAPPVPSVGNGQEQCALALSKRRGAWSCPSSTVKEATALAAQARSEAQTVGVEVVGSAAAGGYCRVEGCWDTLNVATFEFSGGGSYGYGTTRLGTFKGFFHISMNGATSVSKPVYFSSTRSFTGGTMEGERLYLSSSKPAGAPVTPSTYALYGPKGTVTPTGRLEWLPNGYRSYESTVAWAVITHNFVWKDVSSAYPGRWFFYAKSNKLKRQSSGAYYFQG